jgi:hypothetical protein
VLGALRRRFSSGRLGYRLVYLLLWSAGGVDRGLAAARLQLSLVFMAEAPSDGHRVLGRLLRYNDARGDLLSTVRRYLPSPVQDDGKVHWRKLLTRERPRLALAPTSFSRRQPLGGS